MGIKEGGRMERIALVRKMFHASGIFFILFFKLIFIVTNLILIYYLSLHSIIQGQEPFIVLTLSAILACLYKKSFLS